MSTQNEIRDAHFQSILADQMLDFDFESENARQIALAQSSVVRANAADALRVDGPVVATAGGEVARPTGPKSALTNRASRRTKVSTTAAVERLNLIANNDVFELALDTADSIGAENAIEKMIAHEMAAAHKTAMDLLEKNKLTSTTVDEIRRVNAAARLMSVVQQAALTIQRLRSGGAQTVVVKHVTVASGAQAVIGNVGGSAA